MGGQSQESSMSAQSRFPCGFARIVAIWRVGTASPSRRDRGFESPFLRQYRPTAVLGSDQTLLAPLPETNRVGSEHGRIARFRIESTGPTGRRFDVSAVIVILLRAAHRRG